VDGEPGAKRTPVKRYLQLSFHEVSDLRSQIVTSNEGRGGRRHLLYAFTEQGVGMLSTVLEQVEEEEEL